MAQINLVKHYNETLANRKAAQKVLDDAQAEVSKLDGQLLLIQALIAEAQAPEPAAEQANGAATSEPEVESAPPLETVQ